MPCTQCAGHITCGRPASSITSPDLRAGVVRREAPWLARVPVLGGDDDLELRDQAERDRDGGVTVGDRERAARHEVVLQIDEDERAHAAL